MVRFLEILRDTAFDVLPIAVIVFGFQYLVVRKRIARLSPVLIGFGMVLAGLSLFLFGLELALFPMGEAMAAQLASPAYLPPLAEGTARHWADYYWIYLFAFAIGASTTIAEPALIAVALKAGQVSGGTIDPFVLRLVVAAGVAAGITVGVWRIVAGFPLHWLVIGAYVIVILQTLRCPRMMMPLAFD